MKYFTVFEYLGVGTAAVKGGSGTYFRAQCKLCGEKIDIPTYKLRMNKSCGCLIHLPKSESVKKSTRLANTTHGKSISPEYRTWRATKQRCRYTKHKSYAVYGGAGIDMCDEWYNSFQAFYRDMGDRPEGTTIDRIDGTKGYYKDNCRWATPKQQSANQKKRKKRKVT